MALLALAKILYVEGRAFKEVRKAVKEIDLIIVELLAMARHHCLIKYRKTQHESKILSQDLSVNVKVIF